MFHNMRQLLLQLSCEMQQKQQFFFNIAKLFILQPENEATYLAATMSLCKL